MHPLHDQKGTLILEAIIATGLASLFIVAIAGIAINTTKSGIDLERNQKAIAKTQETFDALRSMDFELLSASQNSILSYDNINDRWTIAAGGPEILESGLQRTVTLETVQRDANCRIVSSGGIPDSDTLLARSTVSWQSASGTTREVTGEQIITNWHSPNSECFVAKAADAIVISIDEAYWGGSKQLRNVQITNHTELHLTVTHMTLTWNKPNSKLQQLFAFDTKVWADNGPGLPLGLQSSGALIDILDSSIPPGTTEDAYKIQFTSGMQGTELTISFTFDDGSIYTSEPFTPL